MNRQETKVESKAKPRRVRSRHEASETFVSTIMTKEVITVRPDLSVDSLSQLLLEQGLSRVPVVDEGGRLVGIVSKTDLVDEQHERGDTEVEANERQARLPARKDITYAAPGFHVHGEDASVSEIMKKSAVAIPESATIAEAAGRLASYRLHGLPVVSEQGKVVGMLSALDIAGWLAGL